MRRNPRDTEESNRLLNRRTLMLGGAMGAAVDGSQAVAGGTADTARWAWDRSGGLRETVRDRLSRSWRRGGSAGGRVRCSSRLNQT